MTDYITIADRVVGELQRKGVPSSDEDTAEYVALLIAAEYPDAQENHVKLAIQSGNQRIAGGEVRSVANLRAIQAVSINGLDIADPENVEPICMTVDPATLFVDPMYQRSIGERGLKQIRRIIEAWDWNKFKPPACSYSVHQGQTVLKVFDGQHTAIAAASHPAIKEIPVMIHEAKETAQQAAAFVGQNTNRLAVTALQLHQAALVAGDEDALTVAQVCERAGVRILRFSTKNFTPGDTVAIQAINALVGKRGAMKARVILEVLVKAGMAPIVAPQIRAVETLLTDPEYSSDVTPENITAAITASWLIDSDAAKQLQIAHKWPFWKALAIHWFRNTKKNRAPAGRAA
jgi:hypothetical protein